MTSVEIPINGVEVNSEMDWSSNQLNKFIGQIAANVHEVENECPVVGLAGCHLTENSKIAGTSLSVPSDILGSYEELRWMEPHMSSPSPCCDNTD